MPTKTRSKAPKGFKRVRVEGGYQYRRTLPNGAAVQWSTDTDWSAYDAAGRYLGFVANESDAEYMAKTGQVNVLAETIGELELWELWNEASQRTAVLLCEASGEQVMAFEDGLFLVAAEEDDGWSVTIQEDQNAFYNEQTQCFDLVYIDKDKVFKCR